MEPKMTEISGIGASSARNLEERGLKCVTDVANASVDQVATAQGFGPIRAAEVIGAAAALLTRAAGSVASSPVKQETKGGKLEKESKPAKKAKEKDRKKTKKEKKKARKKANKKNKKSKKKNKKKKK